MSGVSLEEKIKDCEARLNDLGMTTVRGIRDVILVEDSILNLGTLVEMCTNAGVEFDEVLIENDNEWVVQASYPVRESDTEYFNKLISRVLSVVDSSISYADYKRAIRIAEAMK